MSTNVSDDRTRSPLPRSFYERDALEVAPELLNKVLRKGPVAGRIVEVEAYRSDDPASHSYRGRTTRNGAMFAAGGLLYVYLSYGIHHCINVVTGGVSDGQAVLIRGVEVIAGHHHVSRRRNGRTPRDWTNGPGKVAQAFDIDRDDDGTDLTSADGVWITDDGVPPPAAPVITPRIGISRAQDHPWRWVSV